MMNYNHPNQVRSPKGYANHIKPLYDGGEEGFSIGILEDCDGYNNIGIRWNVSDKEREEEISIRGKQNLIDISKERIREEVKRIIDERFGKQLLNL